MNARNYLVHLITLLILSIVLSACTSTSNTRSSNGFEKRRYTKGYHIDIRKHHESRVAKHFIKLEKKIWDLREGYKKDEDNTSVKSPLPGSKNSVTYTEDCGDEILFKTGDKEKVKIIEVGQIDITYKKCDNLAGPSYIIDKSKVSSILYASGKKVVFTHDSDEDDNEDDNKDDNKDEDEYYSTEPSYSVVSPDDVEIKKAEKRAMTSMVLGILSLVLPFGFILGIIALTMGRKSMREFDASDTNNSKRGIAHTGAILGMISIMVTLFVLGLSLFLIAA